MNKQQYQDYSQQAVQKQITQRKEAEHPLILKLRDQLLGRGVAGIKGIGRMFKQLDDDQNKTLTFQEFKDGLINHNVSFTNDEMTSLFKVFDKDGSNTISYDEFLIRLRPPMNQTRMNLVMKAFTKLDKTRDGKITCEDLANVYNVKDNPKFQNGDMTEQQILAQFLDSFEVTQHKDGIVTFDEFVNYYSGVSASIDSDIYFDIMMRNSWKL